MLECMVSLLSLWLLFKASGLLFRLAWGTAKIIAILLIAAACPILLFGLFCVGGAILLIPAGLLLLVWLLLGSLV